MDDGWTEGRWTKTDLKSSTCHYVKGESKNIVFLSLKINFVLADNADPDEMRFYAAIHLDLQFAKVPVMGFPIYKGFNTLQSIYTQFVWCHTLY